MHSPPEILAQGNCRDAPTTEIFYPDRDAETYTRIASQAKKYCHGDGGSGACPVLLECLLYSLVSHERFGIWGGLSPRERNALRRMGTVSGYSYAARHAGSPYYELIERYLERYGDESGVHP